MKCKKCGGELEIDFTKILTSLPEKYEARCKKCGNVEYILCSECHRINQFDDLTINGTNELLKELKDTSDLIDSYKNSLKKDKTIEKLKQQLAEKDKEIKKIKTVIREQDKEIDRLLDFNEKHDLKIRHQVCNEIRHNFYTCKDSYCDKEGIEIITYHINNFILDQIEKGEKK